MPQPIMLKNLKLNGFYEDLKDLLEITHPQNVLFIIGYWNANVGSQEMPGKFGLGVQTKRIPEKHLLLLY